MNQAKTNDEPSLAQRLKIWVWHNASWMLWVYWLVLLIGTHRPKFPTEPPTPPGPLTPVLQYDKLAHFLGFGGLMLLLVMSGLFGRQRSWTGRCGIALLIASCYACVDEVTQHWIPGRELDWTDLLANLMGILTAYMYSVLPRYDAKSKPSIRLKLTIVALIPSALLLFLLPGVEAWVRALEQQVPAIAMVESNSRDYLFHAVVATIFSVLTILAWPMTSRRPRWAMICTVALLLLSAPLIEIAQHYTGRSVQASDARAHIIGVGVAMVWWAIAWTRNLRINEIQKAHEIVKDDG